MKTKVWFSAVAFLLLGVVAVLFLPSCASGPEPFHYGRDACDHCRMHVTEKGFGGEIRDGAGTLTRYDDLGCLVAALREMKAVAGAAEPRVWIEDHVDSGFVPVQEATLVRATGLKTPMGSGVVAFRSAEAAKAAAAEAGGSVVTLEALLAEAPPAGGMAPASAGAGAGAGAAPGGPAGDGSADLARAYAPLPDGKRPLTEQDAMAGKATFVRECSACHGERGDGNGPAADFLEPRPRNLTKGVFKIRSTESGQHARTEDVARTVTRGIPGSAMPAFTYLPPEERRQVIAYVLHLADWLDEKEPEAIPKPSAAPPTTTETIAKGKAVYEDMKCASCHGTGGKGDGPGVESLKDDAGRPIKVRDFTNGIFRGGDAREDLYLRFVTGMDGSPMPSYGDSVKGDDRWALVDYVMSLKVPPAPVVYPKDPLAAGREVAEKFGCRGCHVLDDGKGGEVGPDLRISGQKLASAWVRGFLADPRGAGHIYPWRPHRMPGLKLEPAEVEVMTHYLATMGKRSDEPLKLPDASTFTAAKLEEGKNFYLLRCGECHQLGNVIEVPLAKQQGPDLIHVKDRIDYGWVKKWVMDPKSVDPKSKMTVPELTSDQADSVLEFVWKTSMEAAPKTAAK